MRTRHDRADLLDAAVEVCLEGGLLELTFGAVGRRAGVPDRTIVYYFPHKADLVSAVVEVMALRLVSVLDADLPDARRPPADLLDRMWPALTAATTRPIVHVWLELCALASAGKEPYREAAQGLGELWLAWLTDRVGGRTVEQRSRRAADLLARLDGALVMHHIGLEAAAEAAVRSA